MKSSLPILAGLLTLLLAVATATAQAPVNVAPQAAAPTSPPTASVSGNELLGRAVEAIDGQRSIATKVRFRVDLLARPMIGSGVYLQQGRGPHRQMRFDLNVPSSDKPFVMQQVCDGNQLFVSENYGHEPKLSQIDVARVRRARPNTNEPMPVNLWIALGGLPKMLSNINGAFQFGPAAESALDEGRLPVWTLSGEWKPERLVRLLPNQKDAIAKRAPVDLTKLAPNLPDRVLMHVGRDDLFCYRIEYWRTQRAIKPSANSADRLILVVEFYEVQQGTTIDQRQFAFDAGDAVLTDRTSAFLERFGLEEVPGTGTRPPSARR